MRKFFVLNHPKVKLSRQYEATKLEIRKYFNRERRKTLPEGVDFWDFDCRFGATKEEALDVHASALIASVDAAECNRLTSFYVEILAKHGYRTKKPKTIADTTEIPS